MNRRLVLISQSETPDYPKYWGIGLGNEIYTLEQLEAMDSGDRYNYLTLEKSDAVLLVGAEPFKYLQSRYHYGVRSENYFDCSKLRRLSIEGGAFAKCIVDFPDPDVVNDFMSPDFAKPVDFSWFQQKVIHDYSGAMKFIEYLDSLPLNTYYGFDYEASGMATDKWFELSGVSLCTVEYGGFISFTDIRHTSSPQEYQTLLERLRVFLEKRQDHVWVYNMQYEFQVSHRMLGGVDLYNLCDASVFNILDGNHLKKYSLKWSVQNILQATVWDTEFDRISDLIDSMLFEETGKTKKDRKKILKVDQSNFKNTPEWQELCRRYPAYVGEFESLILEYWGNPFMCIPSDILGYYCNLDAFYTLMLYMAKKDTYSEKAISVFCDNIRLACRLHSCGIPKDEDYRHDYEIYCQEQMAWGITYCAEARCRIKMEKHKRKMADLKKYSPVCVNLLRNNKFHGGDTTLIAKEILLAHIDTMDAYELGVDEGALLLSFGPDFADDFMDLVRKSMEEVEMIKTMKKTGEKKLKAKIDGSIGGKKKILGLIGEGLVSLLGIDKLKLGDKHEELEKYLYYERAYTELMKISSTQLGDINNIPHEIYAFGEKMNLLDYSSYISDHFFKCKSPIENDEICLEFAKLYPSESAYLAAIFESTQQLQGADKFYNNLGIDTVESGFQHFMSEWQKYYSGTPLDQTAYPEKMYTLALDYYNHPEKDQVKEVWSNFNGYSAQSQFFKYVDSEYLDYGKIFDETDLNNNFFFMRKLVLNYLLYKKYAKILATYIDGMFTQTDKWVIEDPESHVVIREADKDEPGAVCKMFAKFQCMEKSSKRWSSGYHTIVSHSDIKSTICSYPGCLLTYFDINLNSIA